jgi:hypothetical protein
MRLILKLKPFLIMNLFMLMVDFGFMNLILMMNINICPMRLLLIIILDNEEYGLDMFYDKALDDRLV